MRFTILFELLLFSQTILAQGYHLDFVDPHPDLTNLYERLSRSDFVIVGRVVEMANVSKRSAKDVVGSRDSSGAMIYRLPPIQDRLAGTMFTIEIERALCRKSDFAAGSSPLQYPSSIRLFAQNYRTSVPSDLNIEQLIPPQTLVTGKSYLLFLKSYIDDEKKQLVWDYDVDGAVTVYRAFEGWRGARELPAAFKVGAPTDYVTPAVTTISSFCQAVSSPDVHLKLGALSALLTSADPGLRVSLAAAINALEGGPAK